MVFMIKLRGITDNLQAPLLVIYKTLSFVGRMSLKPKIRRDWTALREIWVVPALVEEGIQKCPRLLTTTNSSGRDGLTSKVSFTLYLRVA